MKRTYGSQSMIAPLRRVLVRRPDETFAGADPERWHYKGRPILKIAQQEHDGMVAIMRQAAIEVLYHDDALPGISDAIYVHDPAIVTDRGAIILKMGKDLRRGEEGAMARCLEALGVPVIYTLHGQARAEGGDLLWVDHNTLAVGLGFRTNGEGLGQLTEALYARGITILPVELPYYQGPESCLHLMSLISIVDRELAVAYQPLLSAPFWQYLQERSFKLVPVPEEEFVTMGPNVLALAPGKCLMLQGNPVTKKRLEASGCEVLTYQGTEISHRAQGGPTCLTRPILREE
ncbi:MAG: amidinotransferase [candidate division Zixibacteria bacterium SM23_81]|nr:MAG: amidinotransferase [candidate division Zixibacteria bacterium SM23_81]